MECITKSPTFFVDPLMSLQLSVRYPSPSLLFSNGFENTYSVHKPASSLPRQQAVMLRGLSPLPNCVHLKKKSDFHDSHKRKNFFRFPKNIDSTVRRYLIKT